MKAENIEIPNPPVINDISINGGKKALSTSEHWNISVEINGINPNDVKYCYLNFMVSFSYSPSQTGVIVLNYNPVSGKYEGTKECSATSTYRFMYATINKKNKKSIRAFYPMIFLQTVTQLL